MTKVFPGGFLKTGGRISKTGGRFRRTAALAATVTLMGQNFAWAVCSNGQSLPAEIVVMAMAIARYLDRLHGTPIAADVAAAGNC
jgi:hypothetical protein